MFNSVLLKTQV